MTKPLRERLAGLVLKYARRLFGGTVLERLPLTAKVRSIVFRLGYGGGDLVTTIRGVTLALPAEDSVVVPAMAGGYYEELELSIFESLALISSSIADVGGNVGLYACVAASVMPNGNVVTFEPDPANLEFLRGNLRRNHLEDRVEVVPHAVSDSVGNAQLYLMDGIANHTLAGDAATSSRHVDVVTTTIDAHFGGAQIDVLKVDVEGFDAHVLRGARDTLFRHAPAVLIEMSTAQLQKGGTRPRDFVTLLLDVCSHVFILDEPRNSIRAASPDELLALADGWAYTNLVGLSRPAHVDAVERFLS